MRNPLATPGHVVLPAGNYPDVSWIVENLDIENFSDELLDEIVESHVEIFNAYHEEADQVSDLDTIEAKKIVKMLRDNRKNIVGNNTDR